MSSTSSRVTDRQVEQFREQGYLVIESAFDPEEITRMREAADAILELIINSSLANDRQSGRLDVVEGENRQMVRKIQPVNDLSLALSEVSADDRLLDPMRAIMDDEPILMEEKLNYKEPLSEPVRGLDGSRPTSGFAVHNDWAHYKAQNYPQEIISSAIAIDDCTVENGPLHIWPRTHDEHRNHEQSDHGLEIPPDVIDHDGGEDVLVPAGSVMFFHSLLVHNSRANESGMPRRLMIYSHYPETAGIGFDVRNGPTRLRESPHEWEYQRKKDRGEYTDVFEAPTF